MASTGTTQATPAAKVVKIDTSAELAFLDQLAGDLTSVGATNDVKCQKGSEDTAVKHEAAQAGGQAAAAPQASDHNTAGDRQATTAAPEVKAMKIDTSAELAFLDELAGGAPAAVSKVEVKSEEGQAQAPQQPKAQSDTKQDITSTSQHEKQQDKVEVKGENGKEDEDDEETYERDATQLLGAFKDEVSAGATAEEMKQSAEDLMKQFMLDMKAVDRDNEVMRVLWAFKLNAFEKMNLRFTATESEVKTQYRKVSLLIHPDRCKHERAADAFEVLGAAQEELLDPERREQLMRILEYARDAVREERRKATKHDSALRIAATLHEDGRSGVEAEWEKTEDFHEKWKFKARDVLARAEFRRRRLSKRMREEELRIEAGEKETAQERKKARQNHKEWHENRDKRVSSWQDYSKSGRKQGGTKAPKIKTWDADKSYVQRATTEQFIGNYKKRPPK